MYQFCILVYFIIFGLIARLENILYIFLWILAGIIIIAANSLYKKIKKAGIKRHIKNYPNKPVLNVNKAPWWQLEELPGILRVQAKKIVWIRKHNGNYTSKRDFFEKNNISNIEEIKKLIYIN